MKKKGPEYLCAAIPLAIPGDDEVWAVFPENGIHDETSFGELTARTLLDQHRRMADILAAMGVPKTHTHLDSTSVAIPILIDGETGGQVHINIATAGDVRFGYADRPGWLMHMDLWGETRVKLRVKRQGMTFNQAVRHVMKVMSKLEVSE